MEGRESLIIRLEKLDIRRLDGGNSGELGEGDLLLRDSQPEQFRLGPGRNDDRSNKLTNISIALID